jgi:DNA-binding transcriptional ArsR family regulator
MWPPYKVSSMNTRSDEQVLPSTTFDVCGVRVVDIERVEAVREVMPLASDVSALSDIFGLLADPGRLRLLVALLEGEMCVCDLAASTGQSESAVSHALRLLRAHRVVRARRAGRMAYYKLADAHVRLLIDLALTHVGHSPAFAVTPENDGTAVEPLEIKQGRRRE